VVNRSWTALDRDRVVAWNRGGVSYPEIARRLGRTPEAVRGLLHRHARRTGAGLCRADAVAAGRRRDRVKAEAERAIAARRPLVLVELAAAVGCDPPTARRDLEALGLAARFEAGVAPRYRRLGRAANRSRYEAERVAAAVAGWPPLPAGQVAWLAALVRLGGGTGPEWAAAVGRSAKVLRSRDCAGRALVRSGLAVGGWEGRRYVYRPSPEVVAGRRAWEQGRDLR
jgi:DNA-binding Lrp family transcriptional regulator/DNA-binding CsgD family transcriptional regulator